MATAWISLPSGRKMSWGSGISRTPKVDVLEAGDGAVYRYPQGINNNPGEFTITYDNLDVADYQALLAYCNLHSGASTTLLVPVLPEDFSGATTGLFYITKVSTNGDFLRTVTITLRETFYDA